MTRVTHPTGEQEMSKIENGVEVWMIWAVEENESDAPWMIDAWDEWSIEGNSHGWDEAVAKAKAEQAEIRIIKTIIDYAAVQKAFETVEVRSSATEGVSL